MDDFQNNNQDNLNLDYHKQKQKSFTDDQSTVPSDYEI